MENSLKLNIQYFSDLLKKNESERTESNPFALLLSFKGYSLSPSEAMTRNKVLMLI
jgi:hypothetical protein